MEALEYKVLGKYLPIFLRTNKEIDKEHMYTVTYSQQTPKRCSVDGVEYVIKRDDVPDNIYDIMKSAILRASK